MHLLNLVRPFASVYVDVGMHLCFFLGVHDLSACLGTLQFAFAFGFTQHPPSLDIVIAHAALRPDNFGAHCAQRNNN